MDFIKLFIPATFACSCNAAANMFWKMHFDKEPFLLKSVSDFLSMIGSIFIWAGIGCYVCSMLLFFYMLSNFKLSAVTPVTCMTYIFNIIIAKTVFDEHITTTQLVGTAVIICGLVILSRTKAI